MTSIKEINAKIFEFVSDDKNIIINEKIIFIDFSLKTNLLLLLSSHNSIYICEISNDSIKIKKKFESIVDKDIKINKSYFFNEDPNLLLLLCDNYNIYEFTIDREYISHIYYDILGDSYDFKMNCRKNSNSENNIKNFCIHKDNGINVWNSLKYNKKNILTMENINCFSYDNTGLLIYLVGKLNQKNYLKVIKFIDEFDCKEIYNKNLNFLDSKAKSIDYINSFDINIILADKNLGKMFILKNYPIKGIEFEISLNNNSQLYLPFIGSNRLFQFGILCLNINESEQNLINCLQSKEKNIIENMKIKLKISDLCYFKESISEKGLLLEFDDIKKEIKKYSL